MDFNLADLFESVVDVVPDQPALVADARRLTYVALDLAGFRSGSLNEVLPADALVKLRPGRAS